MTANLPAALLQTLRPLTPPASIVHHLLADEAARVAADLAMLRDKNDPQRIQKLADKLTREEVRIRALVGV